MLFIDIFSHLIVKDVLQIWCLNRTCCKVCADSITVK